MLEHLQKYFTVQVFCSNFETVIISFTKTTTAMETGFIKLYRKMTEWEWYQDANVMRVFLHLLLTANHKDGRFQGIAIRRGQTLTGRLKLSAELGISERSIRTSLRKLEQSGEIISEKAQKTTKSGSLITICKYESYQERKDPERPASDQQATSKRPASDQQATTNKNEKNENNKKNDKNYDKGLDDFLTNFNFSFLKKESKEKLKLKFAAIQDLDAEIQTITTKMQNLNSPVRDSDVSRKRGYFLKSLANANEKAAKKQAAKAKISKFKPHRGAGTGVVVGLYKTNEERATAAKQWSVL